jgi:hypothetical protein
MFLIETRPSLSLTQTPNTVSLYPYYLGPLYAMEEIVARVFSPQGISRERK